MARRLGREEFDAPLNFDALPSTAPAKSKRPDVLNFDALVLPRDILEDVGNAGEEGMGIKTSH